VNANSGNKGFQAEGTISDTRETWHLQDNLQKANIMVHFLAMFFLHPKALFYTPF
jgi:hypothetical protein